MKYELRPNVEVAGQPILQLIVHAWQYRKDAPVPVWVAKRFHDLQGHDESTGLTGIIGDELVEAQAGDWILASEDFSEVTILRDHEFQLIFQECDADLTTLTFHHPTHTGEPGTPPEKIPPPP